MDNGCGHCKRVQSLWDKYAEESHQAKTLKVAKVDCTEATPLCSRENIKAYPTFRLFNKKQKFTYRGNRNIVGFAQFVNNNIKIPDGRDVKSSSFFDNAIQMSELVDDDDMIPVKAKVLTTENFQEEVEQGLTFVDFYAPWCPHCVELEPTWNELATRFKHTPQITIAKVDCTADPDLCRVQEIHSFPTLKLFHNGHMISHYKQSRDLNHLIDFVDTSLHQAVVLDDQMTDGDNEAPLQSTDDIVVENIDGDKLIDSIKNTPYLIYFHNSWFSSSQEHLELFPAVVKELADMDINIKLAIIDCNLNQDYCSGLQITSFPQIRYFESETDYVIYNGPLTVAHVIGYLVGLDKLQKEKSKVEL